jgi:uncharacterized protein with FMN-binding domain
MKRAAIVIAATGASLALVFGFHSNSPPATTATSLPAVTASGATVSSKGGTQTVTGTDQPIGGGSTYGDIQVRVSADAGRIVKVDLAKLNVTGPNSQQIANNVVPQLQQQTIAAQSVNINGVSGATYTVQAYKASLQSALDQLAQTGAVNAQAAANNGHSGVAGNHDQEHGD